MSLILNWKPPTPPLERSILPADKRDLVSRFAGYVCSRSSEDG